MTGTELIEAARTAQMLRIYLGESDKTEGRPSFEAVVVAARQAGLAGATVLRGSRGFGANSVVHHPTLFRLSDDLPVVIELVDDAEKIDAFLPRLGELLHGGGLVTLESVRVLRYASRQGTPAP